MADPSDETHHPDTTLRIGGWLPAPREAGPPSPYPSIEPRDGRPGAGPPPGPERSVPAAHQPAPRPGGPKRSLLLGCAVVGALATLAVASSPIWTAPPRPEEGPAAAAPTIPLDQADDTPSATQPTATFSRAPVSLSTRASLRSPTPAASPTDRPRTPTGGTTTSSRPSTTPRAQPRSDELPPLPASQERSLRSSGGGAETFVDFVNDRDGQVVVYWLDYHGQRRRYAVLEPGRSYRQQTYVGHPWVVTDAGGRALACFLPAPETRKAVAR
ncbi:MULTISPECIES: VHL beta domain-containing protein [unclassified Micromonospora]|uniref:VHL beta domain-containing protein n=1 Tax=unclassified Micromonospora TaxID=2617518 RepID=UPI002FF088D6